jgi:hypothetical protein
MVGDYVTYAGVLTGSDFFSAYEIVSNVAIYTKVNPLLSPPWGAVVHPCALGRRQCHHHICWPVAADETHIASCCYRVHSVDSNRN